MKYLKRALAFVLAFAMVFAIGSADVTDSRAAGKTTVDLVINSYYPEKYIGISLKIDGEEYKLTENMERYIIEDSFATSKDSVEFVVDSPNVWSFSVKYSSIDYYVLCSGKYNPKDTPVSVNGFVTSFETKNDITTLTLPISKEDRGTLEGIQLTVKDDSMGDTLISENAPYYKVTFDPNGGTFRTFSWSSDYTGSIGGIKEKTEKYIFSQKEGSQPLKTLFTVYSDYQAIERDGYKLLGWTTKKNKKSTLVDNQTFTVKKDITLYALWKKEAKPAKSKMKKPATPKVTGTMSFNGDGKALLIWKPIKNAAYYEISYSVDGGKNYNVYEVRPADVFTASDFRVGKQDITGAYFFYTYKALSTDVSYTFRVRAIKVVNSRKVYSKYSKAVTVKN